MESHLSSLREKANFDISAAYLFSAKELQANQTFNTIQANETFYTTQWNETFHTAQGNETVLDGSEFGSPFYLYVSFYFGSTSCQGTAYHQYGTTIGIESGVCVPTDTSNWNTSDPIGDIYQIFNVSQVGANLSLTTMLYLSSDCTGEILYQSENVIYQNLDKCISESTSGASYVYSWSTMPVYTSGFLHQ